MASVIPDRDAQIPSTTSFAARVAPWVVRKPHPRVLLVDSREPVRLPLIAELTQLQFVAEVVRSAASARKKFRYPGFHDFILVDSRGCPDGSAILIAQDIRGLEIEHKLTSAKAAHRGDSRWTVPIVTDRCIIIGLCDTADERYKLASAPAAAAAGSPNTYSHGPVVDPDLLAFDLVLRYPLTLHLDFLMTTFSSGEAPPTRAPATAPTHADLVRELNRVAKHRIPPQLRDKLLEQLPKQDAVEQASTEASILHARAKTAEAETLAAKAATSEAERETDAANRHAQQLRTERDDAVEARAVAEMRLQAVEEELARVVAENNQLKHEFRGYREGIASSVSHEVEVALAHVKTLQLNFTAATAATFSPRRKPSPRKKRGASTSVLQVPQVAVAPAQLVADAAAKAVDFAVEMKHLADETHRLRDQLHRTTSSSHAVHAENAVLRLRYARLKQYLTQTGIGGSRGRLPGIDTGSFVMSPSNQAIKPTGSPTPHAYPAPHFTGGQSSLTPHRPDADTHRRQTLRDARLQRQVVRRASAAAFDPSKFVEKTRHVHATNALRRMLRAAEAATMAAWDELSAITSHDALMRHEGVGDALRHDRSELEHVARELDRETSAMFAVPISQLTRRAGSEVAELAEVSQRILTSAEHAAFLNTAFGGIARVLERETILRVKALADLAVSVNGVTDDASRFVATPMDQEAVALVTATVQQLRSRQCYVIAKWTAGAAKRHRAAAQDFADAVRASVRAVESVLVPLSTAKFFASHTSDAEAQTEPSVTAADVDVIGALVDAELAAALTEPDGIATAATLAISLGPLGAVGNASSLNNTLQQHGTASAFGSVWPSSANMLSLIRRPSTDIIGSL
jgi:hypothetical protein